MPSPEEVITEEHVRNRSFPFSIKISMAWFAIGASLVSLGLILNAPKYCLLDSSLILLCPFPAMFGIYQVMRDRKRFKGIVMVERWPMWHSDRCSN
jgi:hypothetical protein